MAGCVVSSIGIRLDRVRLAGRLISAIAIPLLIILICSPVFGLVTPVILESRVTAGAQGPNFSFTAGALSTTVTKSTAGALANWTGGSLTVGGGCYYAGQTTPSKTGDWTFTPAAGRGGYYNVYATWGNNAYQPALNPIWTIHNADADVVVNNQPQTNANGHSWHLLATGVKFDAGVAKMTRLATNPDSVGGKRTYFDSVAFEPCVPTAPTISFPSDGGSNVPVTGLGNEFAWVAGSYNYSYDLYFGTVHDDVANKNGTLIASNLSSPTFDPDSLNMVPGTVYYWMVVAKSVDQTASTAVYSFTAGGFSAAVNPQTWTNGNTVTVTFDASQVMASVNHYEVALDGGSYTTQTSPYAMDVSGAADGTHTVHVKAIDDLDNTLTASLTIYLDKSAPADFVPTANPNTWTSGGSVSIGFSTTDAFSGMNHYELCVDGGSYSTVTSPHSLSTAGLSDGTHTVSVKAIDVAGNSRSKDVTISIDKTAPAVFTPTITPATWTNTNSAQLTFSTTDAASGMDVYLISVDAGSPAPQTSPYTLNTTALTTGSHTVSVIAQDLAGNTRTASVNALIDRVAPSITSCTAPASTNVSPITVTYATSDANSGVKKVDLWYKKGSGGTWTDSTVSSASASGTLSFAGAAGDDTYYFGLVVEDNAGNQTVTNTGAGSCNTAIDSTGPSFTAISASPAAAKVGTVVTITFTASEALTGNPTVKVNGAGATYSTKSGLDYTYSYTIAGGDTEGYADIYVEGTDLASNTNFADDLTHLLIDKTAPADFAPAANPNDWTNGASISITFATTDAVSGISHYVVGVDGGAGTTQTSPYSLSTASLSDGTHTVNVKAIDNAGNELQKDVLIKVDKTAPADFTPTASPGGWVQSGSVDLTFATTDATSGIAHYEVAVDGGAYTAETSPYTLDVSSLADGGHTVHIKAIDNAGNERIKDLSVGLDATAPAAFTPVANPASWTNANSISVTFSTTDAGSGIGHYEVSVDGGAFATQTSPYALDASGLSDGTHTVDVKAIDNAGNSKTGSVTVFVDKTAPADFTPTANPASWTSGNSINITFATTDATAGINRYEVAVDGGSFAAHTSPYTLDVSGLADGTHSVHVAAIDEAGNPKVEEVVIYIDRSGPADFTPTANPAGWTSSGHVSIAFAATDLWSGIDHYEIALDGGAYSTQTSPYDMDVESVADGTHTVHVKAVDVVGNTRVKDVSIHLDTSSPESFTPVANPASWTNANSISISYSTTDADSGIQRYDVMVDGGPGAAHTSPYALDVSGLADGTHTVLVIAHDNAGNSQPGDPLTIYVDKTKPADFTPTANPNSWTNANSVQISFATTDATAGMDHYQVALDGGSYSTQTSPYALDVSAVADGTHTVHVKAVDAAGNELIKDVSIYLERNAPEDFTPTANPASWTKANSVSISFNTTDLGVGVDHYEVALDGDAFSTQTSPYALDVAAAADGTHTVHVKAVDAVGNSLTKDVSIYLDKNDPSGFMPTANPAGWTNAANIAISFSTIDLLSGIDHYEVAVDGGAYTTQTSPYSLDVSGLADGNHTVHVKAIDRALNEMDETVSIAVDKTAPLDFTPAANPASWTSANSVNISFVTTDATSGLDHYQVALDGGAYSTQTSPYTLDISGASDGTHTVHVKAFDAAGNTLTKDVSVYIDRAGPADFTPTANPASWTKNNSVAISFSTTDAGAGIDHYEVALDGGAYSAQASPYSLDVSGATDGNHTVHVKAVDGVGNSLVKDVSIHLDKTAPVDFTPTANPASWTKNNSVSISFSTTDATSGIDEYEVAVDGGGYTTHASPYTLDVSGLSDGTHTVHVKAYDDAGNTLTKDVTIYTDKTAPADFTPIANPASWTSANSASITFATTDANSGINHYEVALDAGGYSTQTSPYTLDISGASDGTHTVHVKALDNAGNVLVENISVYIDRAGPADFTPTANPASWTKNNTVAISFGATDAGSGIDHYQVALDGGAYSTQTSPYSLDVSAVADGTHTVHVKAFDGVGNTLTKDVSIYLDKTAPADFSPTTVPASGLLTGNIMPVSFSTTDATSGIDHYEVTVDAGAYVVATSPCPVDLTGVAEGPHTIHVKAVDVAGNTRIKNIPINIDRTAPADFTPVANPASWTGANTVSITFSTTDSNTGIDHYELALDSGSFTTQTSPYSLDVSAVADGTHTVHVKAFDVAGNSRTKDVSIYLDKSNPADFTPTANPASWTSANSVSISFSTTDAGSGIDHYEVALDAGGYTTRTSPYSIDVSAVADGTHTVHVKAVDGVGNIRVKDVSIYLDKTGPADFTPAANPASWTSANSVSITFAATDATSAIDHYEVAVDAGGYTTHTSPYALDVSAIADGTHTVHVKAFDSAGNTRTKDVTISLDKTQPADFTPTANPNTWTSANSVSVTFSTTDAATAINHYEVAVDSGAYTTQTSPYTLDVSGVADGAHTVHVKAVDSAGNTRIKDVTIQLDKTAPAAFTPVSNPTTWYSFAGASNVQITWATNDAASGVNHYEVALGNGAYTARTSPYSFSAVGFTPGTYTLHIKAFDNAGNVRTVDLVAEVSNDANPPTAALTFEDPLPALGRQFDYVFWKNWAGVTTANQNTYNINWTASDAETGLSDVYIEYRANSSNTWTLLTHSTNGSGTATFDVSSLAESDSYQFRIRAKDQNSNWTVAAYDKFGVYDATKLVPTAKVVAPANGSYLALGSTAKLKVQEIMPVFQDPRVAGKAYKDGSPDWWFSGHSLTATPQLRAYKKKSDGRPSSLHTTLLASIPRSTPAYSANANTSQVSQFLGYVLTNTWEANYTLKKGVVSTSDAFQVELKYSDVVSIGNVRQADKPNIPGQVLPTTKQEPLIDTLKQYEFSRFWVR